MPTKPIAMRLVLSELPGFKTLALVDYESPDGRTLKAKMVAADVIHEAEMKFHEALHHAGYVTTEQVINEILIPCCCEECGGTNFVQKYVRRHGRVIQVLECVSGNMVTNGLGNEVVCRKQHGIDRDKPKELTPTPTQLRIVKQLRNLDMRRKITHSELAHLQPEQEDQDDEPYYMREPEDADR